MLIVIGFVIGGLILGLASGLGASALLLVILTGFYGLAVAFAVGTLLPSQERVTGQARLVPIDSRPDNNGPLFLTSIQIKGKEYFQYLVQKETGGYFPYQFAKNGPITIFEEEIGPNAATVTDFEMSFIKDLYWLVGFDSGKTRSEFHVPQGSVRHTYENA